MRRRGSKRETGRGEGARGEGEEEGGGVRPFANLSEKFLVDRARKSSVVHLRRRISIDYWSWDFIVRFKRFILRSFELDVGIRRRLKLSAVAPVVPVRCPSTL